MPRVSRWLLLATVLLSVPALAQELVDVNMRPSVWNCYDPGTLIANITNLTGQPQDDVGSSGIVQEVMENEPSISGLPVSTAVQASHPNTKSDVSTI